MKNIFEETYQKLQESKRLYEEATSDEQRKDIRKMYNEAEHEVEELGQDACTIYRQYTISKDSGNSRLNISDVLYDNQVEIIVNLLKENNIKEFTFSSTWSRAIEVAWLFQKNGYQLEGLIEINSQYKNFESDEFERIPAYLFKIQ